jgi:hypothetical protein
LIPGIGTFCCGKYSNVRMRAYANRWDVRVSEFDEFTYRSPRFGWCL